MTDILKTTHRFADQIVESAVGDETVLLHLGNGTYYGLDPVGTQIWRMIGQGVAMPEICRRLAEDHAVDVAVIEADARKFLIDLEAQGILVDG